MTKFNQFKYYPSFVTVQILWLNSVCLLKFLNSCMFSTCIAYPIFTDFINLILSCIKSDFHYITSAVETSLWTPRNASPISHPLSALSLFAILAWAFLFIWYQCCAGVGSYTFPRIVLTKSWKCFKQTEYSMKKGNFIKHLSSLQLCLSDHMWALTVLWVKIWISKWDIPLC